MTEKCLFFSLSTIEISVFLIQFIKSKKNNKIKQGIFCEFIITGHSGQWAAKTFLQFYTFISYIFSPMSHAIAFLDFPTAAFPYVENMWTCGSAHFSSNWAACGPWHKLSLAPLNLLMCGFCLSKEMCTHVPPFACSIQLQTSYGCPL